MLFSKDWHSFPFTGNNALLRFLTYAVNHIGRGAVEMILNLERAAVWSGSWSRAFNERAGDCSSYERTGRFPAVGLRIGILILGNTWVSQSCAERMRATPKWGLAHLESHTLLWTWWIVWKKWISTDKSAGNGTFDTLYCATFRAPSFQKP